MKILLWIALCFAVLGFVLLLATGQISISSDDNCPTIMYDLDNGGRCL